MHATSTGFDEALFARRIIRATNHRDVLADPEAIKKIADDIKSGDVYIFERAIEPKQLITIRQYLVGIGKGSLPNYHKIEAGSPNFHRINRWDPRAYVKACFHQFAFFPWNEDVFDLFQLTREIYAMRNMVAGLPSDKFLGRDVQDACAARISFQFYPKGIGGMNMHRDPYDYHQLTVPIVTMSTKGKDFNTGGAYVVGASDERIYLDDISQVGDVIYFNSQTPHGVEKIDEGAEVDWTSFEGRWMMLLAVNKLVESTVVGDAIDLEVNGI